MSGGRGGNGTIALAVADGDGCGGGGASYSASGSAANVDRVTFENVPLDKIVELAKDLPTLAREIPDFGGGVSISDGRSYSIWRDATGLHIRRN